MNEIKTERIEFEYNESYVMCRFCQATITPQNKPLPSTNNKETDILNLKEQIQKQEEENERLKQENKLFETELQYYKSIYKINEKNLNEVKVIKIIYIFFPYRCQYLKA